MIGQKTTTNNHPTTTTTAAGTNTVLDFDGELIVEYKPSMGLLFSRVASEPKCVFICCLKVLSFFVIQFQETECGMRDCGHDSGCIAERSQETAENELI